DLSDDDRLKVFRNWNGGDKRIMVCTAAFGAGNDYPHVRFVVHANTPREMIGFVQEVSRAGRDGQAANCYTLPKLGVQRPPSLPEDYPGNMAIWEMIYSSNTCIRFLITKFNDGVGVHCKDQPRAMNCSRC
ncbi:hypothetical protein FPV67DRAFT_1378313, partial [Lyophyllum atratum]